MNDEKTTYSFMSKWFFSYKMALLILKKNLRLMRKGVE